MTLLQMLQEFAVRTGLPRPVVGVAGTNPQVLQMIGLLNEELAELTTSFEWTQLQDICTFNTIAAQNQGDVETLAGRPVDKIVNDTLWNGNTRIPLAGPTSQQEWTTVRVMGLASPMFRYRIRAGSLFLFPTPAAGISITFEFMNRRGVMAVGGGRKANFTADTDSPVFPDELMIGALRWRWKREKGLTYAEDKFRYEQIRDAYKQGDATKRTLSLNRPGGLCGCDDDPCKPTVVVGNLLPNPPACPILSAPLPGVSLVAPASLVVTWRESEGASGYKIYLDDVAIATTGDRVFTVTLGGLTLGAHVVRVTAMRASFAQESAGCDEESFVVVEADIICCYSIIEGPSDPFGVDPDGYNGQVDGDVWTGRFVMSDSGTMDRKISYSDDDGATWTPCALVGGPAIPTPNNGWAAFMTVRHNGRSGANSQWLAIEFQATGVAVDTKWGLWTSVDGATFTFQTQIAAVNPAFRNRYAVDLCNNREDSADNLWIVVSDFGEIVRIIPGLVATEPSMPAVVITGEFGFGAAYGGSGRWLAGMLTDSNPNVLPLIQSIDNGITWGLVPGDPQVINPSVWADWTGMVSNVAFIRSLNKWVAVEGSGASIILDLDFSNPTLNHTAIKDWLNGRVMLDIMDYGQNGLRDTRCQMAFATGPFNGNDFVAVWSTEDGLLWVAQIPLFYYAAGAPRDFIQTIQSNYKDSASLRYVLTGEASVQGATVTGLASPSECLDVIHNEVFNESNQGVEEFILGNPDGVPVGWWWANQLFMWDDPGVLPVDYSWPYDLAPGTYHILPIVGVPVGYPGYVQAVAGVEYDAALFATPIVVTIDAQGKQTFAANASVFQFAPFAPPADFQVGFALKVNEPTRLAVQQVRLVPQNATPFSFPIFGDPDYTPYLTAVMEWNP